MCVCVCVFFWAALYLQMDGSPRFTRDLSALRGLPRVSAAGGGMAAAVGVPDGGLPYHGGASEGNLVGEDGEIKAPE